MLSRNDTDLLARVGPGTPMGNLMREYWMPALYSWELEPDGAPERIRILGEDLIAWRNTDGSLGVMQNACPHRGASMFFGRNEENGLRCVYHGWKFDTTGECVDMPNEPAESNFKHKIKATAYAAAEQGEVVFLYMGTRQATPPGLPQFEWATVPAEQRFHHFKGMYLANWAQAMEGEVDTSHVYFLHGRLRGEDPAKFGTYHPDKSPRLEILETDTGILYGARREQGDGSIYWRTTQMVFPSYAFFPGQEDGTGNLHMYTPVDDEHTLHWGLNWHPTRAIPGERKLTQHFDPMGGVNGMGAMKEPQLGQPFPNWWPETGPENDFHQNYEVQRKYRFSGVPTVRLQDGAMFWSMGAIMDRTKEHLGTADAAVIRARRLFINWALTLRDTGVAPAPVSDPSLFNVRSTSAVLPGGTDWRDALADWHHARTTAVPAEVYGKSGFARPNQG